MNNELELLIHNQNKILAYLNKNNRRYFHPNTVNNLIFHFNEINIEADKEWILKNLREYFSECEHLCNNLSRSSGHELYMKYLYKITDYYHNNLKFVQSDRALFVLFYLGLFIALYFIFGFLISIIAIAIFIFRFVVLFKKYKQKRVFSLYY